MKLSQFKQALSESTNLNFTLPDGQYIPPHFHITEAGLSSKHFIDCGGTIRTEKTASFQIWVAQDIDHRLSPAKLENIIRKAQPLFGDEDLDIEIEYQGDTVGRYAIGFTGDSFQLKPRYTDCLAKDNCGVPAEKEAFKTTALQSEACCTPGGGCC